VTRAVRVFAGHSLVQVEPTHEEPRFRMLQTVREFVASLPATDPGLATVERRHADYIRELAERADRPLRGLGQTEWAERLEADAGNIGAAIRWLLAHDIRPLPHLLRTLWLFWWLRDHLIEARSWTDELISRLESFEKHAQAEPNLVAAITAIELGDDEDALAASERLGSLLDEIDDPCLAAMCHLAKAWVAARSMIWAALCGRHPWAVTSCKVRTSRSGPRSQPPRSDLWRSPAGTTRKACDTWLKDAIWASFFDLLGSARVNL
jgi:hypothetical protein